MRGLAEMAAAHLFDLSELHFGLGAGPPTGINRVGLAYLAALQASSVPLYGLVHYRWGAALLDRVGVEAYAERFLGDIRFESAGRVARFVNRLALPQAASLAFLWSRAIAWGPVSLLGRKLERHLPRGTTWISTSIGNLDTDLFKALRQVPNMRIAAMIHDTIPLDYPEFVPAGGKDWFARRLLAVSAHVDLAIYNSAFSQRRAEHHMNEMQRVPPCVTAHLGVDNLHVDMTLLPAGLDFRRPTFVVLGTIEPRKNHALLLDLWDGFAEARAAGDPRPIPQLLIIGRRGWRNEGVFQRLDASPLRGQDVHELADLPDGGVAAALTKARALLFPSYVEGFGLPTLEAAMLSCPVIANDLPVYREFLAELPTYASIDDPARWAALIRAAAANPAPPRPAPPSSPPTWAKHFAKVLPRL